MSIYRKFDIDPPTGVVVNETMEEGFVPRRTASGMSVRLEEHRHLRKAAPANTPLPRTLKWVATLPPNVQPTALLRHYARIANVIAATWGHATSLRSYMDCLFSDNRGNREGFPPEVLSELSTLRDYLDAHRDDNSADRPR